ncbi:MAG: hypothetical protein JWO91_549 [Acidobacteriaceae bacterium]|nr:hypothetical protein [Acidobacteriaceae bacterium]
MPLCKQTITPAERTRIDGDRLQCKKCQRDICRREESLGSLRSVLGAVVYRKIVCGDPRFNVAVGKKADVIMPVAFAALVTLQFWLSGNSVIRRITI